MLVICSVDTIFLINTLYYHRIVFTKGYKTRVIIVQPFYWIELFDIIADSPEISPDHFDWYFYQGRAIGLMVDVNGGSFCSGKILLGSYMKKPLWVDHSTTTVSRLLPLTSCVVVFFMSSLPLCPLVYQVSWNALFY